MKISTAKLRALVDEALAQDRAAWDKEEADFAARQAHRLVEVDRCGEVLEIAGRLGNAQDPFERTAGDAHLAPGLAGNAADGLQPCGV